jgi:hypothetical protein
MVNSDPPARTLVTAKRPANTKRGQSKEGRHMTTSGSVTRRVGLGLAILGTTAMVAMAQVPPVLTRAQVVSGEGDACPVLLLMFSQPVTLSGQSRSADGGALVLTLRQGTTDQGGAAPGDVGPHSVDLLGLGSAGLALDSTDAGADLTISFAIAPAAAEARQAGPGSVVVAMTPPGATCGETVGPAVPDRPDSGDAPALDAARASLLAGEPQRAVQILTAHLATPEGAADPDARELLGLAHERAGQNAHAMAEYRIYLETWPEGEGAARVSQRLLALETAEANASAPLRAADDDSPARTDTRAAAPMDAGEAAPRITSIPRRNDSFPPLQNQPGPRGPIGGSLPSTADVRAGDGGNQPEGPADNFEASVSATWYLNQASTYITELDTDTTDEETELLQNSVVLHFDVSDSRTRNGVTFDWRLAGEQELDLLDAADSELSFSRAYGQLTWGDSGMALAFGRQSWNDDATLGRYDGLRLVVPAGERLKFGFIAGLDVDSTSDALFSGPSSVLGVIAEVTGLPKGNELAAFGIATQTDGFLDRAELGVEGRWTVNKQTVYGLVDVDLVFGRLDNAKLAWSRAFADKSTVSVTLDYSHSPGLALSNALTGQSVTSLSALSGIYTQAEIEALALDRTSEVRSLSLLWSKPLSDDWMLSADLAVYDTSGMPASGGVAAVPAPGVETYAGVQLFGTNVFRPEDSLSLAARLSDTASSRLVLLDGSWRAKLTPQLALKPRLRVARRWFKTGGDETFAIPSLAVDYNLPSDLTLSLEFGARFSTQSTPGFTEESNEPWITASLTKSF